MANDPAAIPQNSPPPGWGTDSLSDFFQRAAHNGWASFTQSTTQPWYDKLAAIDAAFVSAIDLMGVHGTPFAEALMLVNAHAAFRAAAEFSLQTRTCESYVLMRSCLEYALYAGHFHRDPKLFDIWAHRTDGEKQRKEVRDNFKIGEMLGGMTAMSNAIGPRAKQLYEQAIDMGAHPNETGFFGRLAIKDLENGKAQILVKYLDDAPLAYLSTMKAAAQVGVCCLECFWLIFRERFDLTGMAERIEGLKKGL